MRHILVAQVGCRLVADSDRIERDQQSVDEDAQNGQEGVQHEHHALDEQDERAQYGNDDVELGHAITTVSMR